MQGNLTHAELSVAVEMLSSVAVINRALDSGDVSTVWKQLSNPVTGLTNVEDENSQRWVFWKVTSVFDNAYICEFGFLLFGFFFSLTLQVLSLLTTILILSIGSCILSLHLLFLTNLIYVLSLGLSSRFHNRDMFWYYWVLNCTRPAHPLCFLPETVIWCLSAFLDCFALELTALLMDFSFFLFPLSYLSVLTHVLLLLLCV